VCKWALIALPSRVFAPARACLLTCPQINIEEAAGVRAPGHVWSDTKGVSRSLRYCCIRCHAVGVVLEIVVLGGGGVCVCWWRDSKPWLSLYEKEQCPCVQAV
jgi:hypothetical protein